MRHRALLALALLASAPACATARMAVPAELSDAPELAVQGRQGWRIRQTLRFGDYAAGAISRSSTRTESDPRVLGSRERARQRYHFRFREGETELWRVECANRAGVSRSRLPVVGEVTHGDTASLECTLARAGEGTEVWRLALGAGRGGEEMRGTLSGQAGRYELAPTAGLQGSRFQGGDETGYVFLDGGRPAAAVDVLGNGRVRLSPALDADRRGLLAAAAAAILLRDELEEDIDRG